MASDTSEQVAGYSEPVAQCWQLSEGPVSIRLH